MNNTVIFGNSGSGKSTLAKELASDLNIAHLDLDSLAWQATSPPQRAALSESKEKITDFITQNKHWIIEGCYSDLLSFVLPSCQQIYFMNLSIDACIENATNRLWEPHKYQTKQMQDENLPMLIEWIQAYHSRDDVFSYQAHQQLFDDFVGAKKQLISNS